LKSYEIYGALQALTSASAEILTIAIGAFYASLISLSVIIIIARNMSDPGYQGSRDSLAKNSLLYLYVFITLTYFGTSLIGITPSSIITHSYNANIFNIGVIFASGAILYVGLIEVPYRLGAQEDRNRKLREETERLKDLEQQFNDVFSKNLHPDFAALFYQREWLKSRIDELNNTIASNCCCLLVRNSDRNCSTTFH
jgi:pheromone shutdown protein TraB